MNEIRNTGIPFSRVLPAGRKERVSERSSEPVAASSDDSDTLVMERRRNPDRRRRNAGKPGFERRTSSDRRRPRIDIDV